MAVGQAALNQTSVKKRRATLGASEKKGPGKLESFKLKERQKEFDRKSKELT